MEQSGQISLRAVTTARELPPENNLPVWVFTARLISVMIGKVLKISVGGMEASGNDALDLEFAENADEPTDVSFNI